jgi:hypothetical protein
MGLGVTLAMGDRFGEAKPLFEEEVRGFRELGDQHWEMQTSRRLAWTLDVLGDIAQARQIHEDNLRRAREQGDVFIEARTLAVLAMYHLEEGQVESAVPLLVEAQRLQQGRTAIPDRYNSVTNVCRFARALALKGEAAGAIRLLASAEAAYEELDVHQGQGEGWIRRMNDETREMASASIDEATAAREAVEGRKLTIDQAVTLALDTLAE